MTGSPASGRGIDHTSIRDVYGAAVHTVHGNVIVNGGGGVSWPHQVGVVPALADCRQDRPADQALRSAAAADAAAVVVCQVLTGLGGVGKTQLAAGLAHHLWASGQVDLLVWVTATSRSSVIDAYANAAAEVTGVDDLDSERAAARLLAWLAKPGCRWLVVLDDIQDPSDLTGLWPPAVQTGRTVATSRRHDPALVAGRHRIDVDLFTPEQATTYLQAKLAGFPERLDEPDQLATDLGRLPLALAQAATTIAEDPHLTCAGYRRLLADHKHRLADFGPMSLPDDYRVTLAAAWVMSTDRVDQMAPQGLARPLLQLASVLDPNGIPESVLTAPIVTAWLSSLRLADVGLRTNPTKMAHLLTAVDPATRHRPTGFRRVVWPLQRRAAAWVTTAFTDAMVTVDVVHRAVGRLDLFSLASYTPADQVDGTRTLRVHSMIQRATLDQTPADRIAEAVHIAADALVAAWPRHERLNQAFRANANILAAHHATQLWNKHGGGAHPLLFQIGTSLGESGQVTAATEYFQHLHADCLRVLGPDHPDTLTTRHNLAGWRGQAGDAAGAAAAFEQLLDDRLRVLGPDHPATLTTRHSLAHRRGQAGDAAGAAAAFEQLLDDYLRVLDPDHPATLNTRHSLAQWRGEAGDAAGAAAAFEQLLDDRLRVLGPDHPATLTTRHNLAQWRGQAGDTAGAAAAFEQLLNDSLRVLGPDHPDTLTTRNNLAHWRGEAGDAAGAAAAFEQLLNDSLRVLGPDLPETLTTRHNLAHWRGEAGNAAGAAAALEQLLDDYLRVLGPDHPATLNTRNNLARWRGEAGNAAGAAAAFEQLLDDYLRVLDPDHPATLNTRNNLARWRGQAGDTAGAATAFEQLLNDRLRVLGPDHPETLTTRHNLAYWRGQAGDTAGAAAAFEQLLNDRLRVLGPDHPETLNTRHNLAYWRGQAGDAAGAAAAFEQLLDDYLRVLGPDHPETLNTRLNLAYWRKRAERTQPPSTESAK